MGQGIRILLGSTLDDATSEQMVRPQSHREALPLILLAVREAAPGRPKMQHFAVEEKDQDRPGSEQPQRALRDRVEHWPDIGLCSADCPQNLARRRLPLERMFRFVEQSDILDGDDRLVGEGPHE